MKKETYTFWLPLIAGGIALLSGFVVWSVNVYRVTYLTIRGEQYLAGGALLLALVPMVIFIRKGRLKGKRVAGAIKLYLGFFICSLPVAMFVIFTTAWLLEGDYSSWSKPYRYESSTRHSCSGAEVYEPELKKRSASVTRRVTSIPTLPCTWKSGVIRWGLWCSGRSRAPESVKLRARKSPSARLQHPKAHNTRTAQLFRPI